MCFIKRGADRAGTLARGSRSQRVRAASGCELQYAEGRGRMDVHSQGCTVLCMHDTFDGPEMQSRRCWFHTPARTANGIVVV